MDLLTSNPSTEFALGAMALACAILYSAWHEYAAKNRRDARLLAAIGTVGLMGSTLHWLQ